MSTSHSGAVLRIHHVEDVLLHADVYSLRIHGDFHTEGFAVLDSGSSRHVSRRVKVTDPNAMIMLRGFSRETKASGGTGDLNVRVTTTSGAKIDINLDAADQIDTASHDLLSVGRLIKEGWSFHLDDSDHLKAWSPEGEEIMLALTDSDLLSLPLSGGEVN